MIGQARKTPAIEKPANAPVLLSLLGRTRNDFPVIGAFGSVLFLIPGGPNPRAREVAAVPETRHAFSRALNAGRRGLGDDPLDAAGTAPALDAAMALSPLDCAPNIGSSCARAALSETASPSHIPSGVRRRRAHPGLCCHLLLRHPSMASVSLTMTTIDLCAGDLLA